MSLQDQTTLENLGEQILGPRRFRTSKKPETGPDGTYKGGTAFERSYRAKEVKDTRCYTNAYSYQDQTSIASTAVGSKRTGGDRENLDI